MSRLLCAQEERRDAGRWVWMLLKSYLRTHAHMHLGIFASDGWDQLPRFSRPHIQVRACSWESVWYSQCLAQQVYWASLPSHPGPTSTFISIAKLSHTQNLPYLLEMNILYFLDVEFSISLKVFLNYIFSCCIFSNYSGSNVYSFLYFCSFSDMLFSYES